MSVPSWVDSRAIIFAITIAAAGVLSWARLETLGESVHKVQATLEESQIAVSEHVQSPDAHATRGIRVAELESDQGKVEQKIDQLDVRQQKMERNVVALCTTLGARCE